MDNKVHTPIFLFIFFFHFAWTSFKEKVIAITDYESVDDASDESSAVEKKEAGDGFIYIYKHMHHC